VEWVGVWWGGQVGFRVQGLGLKFQGFRARRGRTFGAGDDPPAPHHGGPALSRRRRGAVGSGWVLAEV
jgi:hypothetical protein